MRNELVKSNQAEGGKITEPTDYPVEIGDVLNSLPENDRIECQECIGQLSGDVVSKITALLKQEIEDENKPKKSAFAEALDEANREDRARDRAFDRDDIKEFNAAELPSGLKANMMELFPKYLEEELMGCELYEDFQSVAGNFVDKLWSCRGKKDFNTPEKPYLDDAGQRYSGFNFKFSELLKKEKQIKEKIGKRKRVPSNLQKELSEVENALAKLRDERFSVDFDYHDVRGERQKSFEHRNRYKTGVYYSEYFPSDEYAVLLLETFDNEINWKSKRMYRNASPELLDFNARFFEEWAGRHAGEPALEGHGKRSREEKIEFLASQFVSRARSYLRHKGNENIGEAEKESPGKELVVLLRMLKKY